jgi:ATP-binding cassette subfamily G (WHITE) protein 2 (SNQ2)
MGTVFVRLPDSTATYFSRGGVLFLWVVPACCLAAGSDEGLRSALLFSALSSMAEIPALFSQRPIVLRHQKAALYHPFIEALALTLVDIPITFSTSIIFAVILYFLVGLQQSAQQFLCVRLKFFLRVFPAYSSFSVASFICSSSR